MPLLKNCPGFRPFFLVVYFFERTRPAASMRPPCLIYLSTSMTMQIEQRVENPLVDPGMFKYYPLLWSRSLTQKMYVFLRVRSTPCKCCIRSQMRSSPGLRLRLTALLILVELVWWISHSFIGKGLFRFLYELPRKSHENSFLRNLRETPRL